MPLRIVIRAFDSPAWGGANTRKNTMFLLRLRHQLRALAFREGGPIPCVAFMTLSSSAATRTSDTANASHRYAQLCDGCIGLSSFAASPELRTAFSEYTGALRVFKTPAIGTLSNPSLRASVLRGMGAATYATDVQHGGGSGGGENNLAFKVKRKRLAIETLHLDIEGGVSERRTKPVSATGSGPEKPAERGAAPQPEPPHAPSSRTLEGSAPGRPPPTAAAAPPPSFKGLTSLRQRGADANVQVKLDAGQRDRDNTSGPRFSSDRAEDYEF